MHVTDIQVQSDGARSTLTIVPEPATLLLLGFGGLILRKRKYFTLFLGVYYVR